MLVARVQILGQFWLKLWVEMSLFQCCHWNIMSIYNNIIAWKHYSNDLDLTIMTNITVMTLTLLWSPWPSNNHFATTVRISLYNQSQEIEGQVDLTGSTLWEVITYFVLLISLTIIQIERLSIEVIIQWFQLINSLSNWLWRCLAIIPILQAATDNCTVYKDCTLCSSHNLCHQF